MALATALGLPPYAAVGLSEPGPELTEELGRELSSAVAGKVPGLSGGPGLTEATAWKMGADANQLQHIRTIMEAIPGAIKEEQTLVRTQEGPIYGRMTFILARGDKCYRLQMWFDITDYIRAEEAARAAEPELPPAHTDTPEAPAEELPQPQASEKPLTLTSPSTNPIQTHEAQIPYSHHLCHRASNRRNTRHTPDCHKR